jgi:L-fuconolactonase
VVRIDAHHHFWRYSPEEYGWIDDQMLKIRRDFLPADLEHEMKKAGVHGAISVQARQSLLETDFLLEQARTNPFILGTVGWVPLIDPRFETVLARYADEGRLCGIRHILQSEADDFYMLRDDFNRGVSALQKTGLPYDILIFERHLPQTITFVDRHPTQVFVLDHVAKPRVKEGALSPWREHMQELAKRPNVFCKLSGMVTEADWQSWSPDGLRPYFDVVLEAFGPQRLMFGSDWPVCLLAAEYSEWLHVVAEQIEHLSSNEQEWIWSRSAAEAYTLSPLPAV